MGAVEAELKIAFLFLYLPQQKSQRGLIDILNHIKTYNMPISSICMDTNERRKKISKDALSKLEKEPILVIMNGKNSGNKKCQQTVTTYAISQLPLFISELNRITGEQYPTSYPIIPE